MSIYIATISQIMLLEYKLSILFLSFQKLFGEKAKVDIYDGRNTYKIWKSPPSHDQLAKLARYVVHIAGNFRLVFICSKIF